MRTMRRYTILVAGLLLSGTLYAQIDQLPNIKAGINIGAYVAGEEFTRTVDDYTLRPALALSLEYPLMPRYGFNGELVGGIISKDVERIKKWDATYPYDKLSYKTTVIGTIIGPYYRIPFISNTFSASLHANMGLFSRITTGRKDGVYFTDPVTMIFTWGVGVSTRYAITPTMSAQIAYNGFLTNTDQLDGFASGKDGDGFSHFSIGLVWNLYNDRTDDLPYETFASDAEDVIKQASEKIDLRTQGKSVWKSEVDETTIKETDAALTYSSLELSEFASISELQKDESRLILTIDKRGLATLPLEIGFELWKDGAVVAQGAKTVNILQQRSALTAGQFIDFRGLNIKPGFNNTLPDGGYEVRVTLEDTRSRDKSSNSIAFYRVNMDRLFGERTEEMRELIDENQATVIPSKNNEVLIKVLPNNGRPLEANKRVSYGAAGMPEVGEDNDLEQQSNLVELETSVTKTFDIALGIQNKLVQSANPVNKPVILLAEIYFDAEEETYLDEDDKQLLYNIAQRMRTHPQIRMELRGLADEYNDPTRSTQLAEIRAHRVMDSLSRLLVPDYRMSVSATPMAKQWHGDGKQSSRLENRKVSLVMTSY